jgi:hypothetical protein
LALLAIGLIGLAVLVRWLRGSSRSVNAAAAGIVLLFIFIVLRAASFHHIDHWVTIDIAGLRSCWWLELAGIVVTGASALFFARRSRSDSESSRAT